MLTKLWLAIRPVLFWNYRRGSWQYDLIAAAILAFIFLTPRGMFNDGPRLPSAHSPSVLQVESMNDGQGTRVFLVEQSAIGDLPAPEREQKLQELLRRRTGKSFQIIETRPSAGASGEVTAYLVYARP